MSAQVHRRVAPAGSRGHRPGSLGLPLRLLSRALLIGLMCAPAFCRPPPAPQALGVDPPHDAAGVAFPRSKEAYHQPVDSPTYILQGNGGSFSHNQPFSLYAWDYSMPVGSVVRAARAGVVRYVRSDSNVGGAYFPDFMYEGNFILIDHLDGTVAQYYHLSKEGFLVRTGEYVLQGEAIACSGDTGFTLGPHLHFAVLEQETLKSLPIRFKDFKENHGIPREGDRVPAAEPPRIPEDVILRYKKCWRASRRAEALGALDVALLEAGDVPEALQSPYYFYEHALAARKAELLCKVRERAAVLAAALEAEPAGDADPIREGFRYRITLHDYPDESLQDGLRALEQAMLGPDGRRFSAGRVEEAAVRDWAEGLRRESEESALQAMECYESAFERDPKGIGPLARVALMRVIDQSRRRIQQRFTRLEYESRIARAPHRLRIVSDARSLWEETLPLLQAWVVHYPTERRGALEVFASIRISYEKLLDF